MPRVSQQRQVAKTLLAARGMARMAELRDAGVTAATVSRMERDGDIVRLARGLYQIQGAELDAQHTLAEVAKIVPKGVICLTSALAFHGLTDQLPRKVWLAIGQSDWAPQRAHPPIRVVRMTDALLARDIELHKIEGVSVRVFSAARTIVDCFRHRRSVGLAVAIEGLQEALRQRIVKASDITRHADRGGVTTIVRPYLEALTANG